MTFFHVSDPVTTASDTYLKIGYFELKMGQNHDGVIPNYDFEGSDSCDAHVGGGSFF